jgi:hypothetical protein
VRVLADRSEAACQPVIFARQIGARVPIRRLPAGPARSRPARLGVASSIAASLFFWSAFAAALDGEPPPPAPGCPPSVARSALATGAALMPGALVHGSGHFVLCEPEIARTLLYLEGVGAGSAVLSATGLAVTGASRYVVGPLAIGAIGGLGLFTITWLADIYGVVAPEGGFGQPAPYLPRLIIQSGVRTVYDPLFATRWLLSQAFVLDAGPLWIAPRLDASPDAKHRRYALAVGRRVLGAGGAARLHRTATLDVRLAIRDFAEETEGFGVTSAELALAGRLDLQELGHTLTGSFAFAELGYGREWHRFDGAPGYDWDALLARWGFGIYLGHGRSRGEAWVAYDHRRDTVAGGLHVPGIGAGYAGFLEARGELYLRPHVGAALELAYGSAVVGSAYLLVELPETGR